MQAGLVRLWWVNIYPFFYWFRLPLAASSLFLALCIFTGVQLGWFRAPFSSLSPLAAVPSSSSVVIEIRDWENSQNRLQAAQYANALKAIGASEHWVDELALWQKELARLKRDKHPFAKKQIFTAVQLNGAQSLSYLHIAAQFPKELRPTQLAAQLKVPITDKHSYRGSQIYQLELPGKERFSLCQYRSLLLFSRESALVEAALEQLGSIRSSLSWEQDFLALQDNRSDSDLSFYINFQNLPLLANLLSGQSLPFVEGLANDFSWQGFDCRFQEQHLVGSGQLYLAQKDSYWSYLLNAPSNENSQIAAYLPEQLAFALTVNISAFGDYYRQQKELDPDFSRYILPYLGRELAFFMQEPAQEEDLQPAYAVALALQNPLEAKEKLKKLEGEKGLLDSMQYQGAEIRRLAKNGLLSPLFGGEFAPLQTPYYLIADNYLILANSRRQLERWWEQYQNKKMLVHNPVFKGQVEQMKNRSTLYFLINTPNAALLFKKFLRKDWRDAFDQRFLAFRSLYPMGLQLTAHKGHFLSTFSAATQALQEQAGAELLWRAALDSSLLMPPSLLQNPKTGSYFIAAQDKAKRLYLFNNAGELLWKKALGEQLLGPPQLVDYYSNGNYQLAANTKSKIYIWEEDGELLKDIPLVIRALNAVMSVDYGRGLRFFVSAADKNIYGFDKFGKPLEGWNPNSKMGALRFPLRYLEKGEKDYILGMSGSGQLYFMKRSGDRRMPTKSFKGYYLDNFYLDLEQERIVAGASNGQIEVCNLQGKKFGIPPPEKNMKGVQFAYADLLGDLRPDFLRLMGQKLYIHYYDTAQSLQAAPVYEYEAPQTDIFPIRLLAQEKALLGSYSATKGQIYLIDAAGKLQKGFPLAADGPFVVVDLFDDNNNVLLCSQGKELKAYKLR